MIGSQTFPLGKPFSKSPEGTVRALKEMGLDIIEPLVVLQERQGLLPKRFWSFSMIRRLMPLIRELGMSVPSVHVGAGFGGKILPAHKLIRGIRRIHELTGATNFAFSGMFSDASGAASWAAVLSQVADAVEEQGLQILYHNHSDEFAEVSPEGEPMPAMDWFFRLAPKVGLQLDIGWARVAGDEVAIARKYADRILELHCKDFYPEALNGKPRTKMTPADFSPIGCGAVRTAEVIALRDQFPRFNGVIVIDQDHTTGDILRDIRQGLTNIQAMLSET